MKVLFTENGWTQYLYWQQTDRKKLKRINELIRDIQRQPYQGLGKPEALKGDFAGFWSRRIDDEHRLVYHLQADMVCISQCRFHYR